MTDATVREARRSDLPALVAMLADDPLGATREDASAPLAAGYVKAFDSIESDPNQELLVLEVDGAAAGFLQLTFIPYLTYQGRWRGLIESVRVAADHRGRGLGERLVGHAIDRSKSRRCHLVQLTTDKQRPDALRFYERLGFKASHEGMKLHLE